MVIRRVVASVVGRQVRHVRPVPEGAATGSVAEVYAQCAQEMRLVIPPVLLHSPAPRTLSAFWMLMREPLLVVGRVDRLAKEAVAAGVSVANICPYCVDMHSTGMYALADENDAEAVVADRPDDVADPRVRELVAWARAAHLPDDPASRSPYPAAELPELVGVVVAFHYLTRMVNVFLSSFLLPPGLHPPARRRLKRAISRRLDPALRDEPTPGRSLPLLPTAVLPPDAAWAAADPNVADAVARAYAAFDAVGRQAVSPQVRDVVENRLSRWRGEETGLSRQWCEDLIDGLPDADRAAARLALLTALASYQVDAEVVDEFRRHHPDDSQLVEVAAWASFLAARQVGRWQVPAALPHPAH
ncbi:carboxymuconolactone decarboxylase family protein [Solwaraspora sp. WMMD406]|uniref:carboxymuconolactone decarboxylase family protein n=1 Tax=Solwaraspora sp. WMMD406 TaxID=3016095 RepID=UPI00241727E2|nr:carboxymuconolactone decarboxylase family protein [Solwaraspora sp. WMMD406]MDG4764719.1 carboxymuconolactone decarboxylase family protein [Solwaraspora sp. WMMD406]